MDFVSRITRLPRPYEPDLGAETAEFLPAAAGQIKALLIGAGGCSPYLKSLIAREAEWLSDAFDDPEGGFEREMARIREIAPDQIGQELRRAKRRVALLTGLADLSGVWTLEGVTGRLSDFAGLAVHLALRAEISTEIRRGKLPGAVAEDAETAAGMVALAMGKMGAGELNYSSDIDLICLFDETRFEPDDFHDARAGFIRATRRMSSTLSDLTAEGYVFRTDLRLRPDPAVTPVCIAMEAAERYYESLGRTWERAAYIKARAAAGDIAAGERFLQSLRPFVWRRHLDFAAIQDAHDMRLRIREHKGTGGPITLPDHDMKLGRGGIREIEFFTQTRQIIAGGRDPDLRVRGTVEGLDILARKGWIDESDARVLAEHYRWHREVEHRVQMINDAQTHRLPRSEEGFERLACFMGTDRPALEAELRRRLGEVHELTEGFFAPEAGTGAEPLADHEIMGRWPTYPAFRSERATEIFNRFKPDLLRRLNARTQHPEEALVALDGFLQGLPAGVQLFSLFEANPQLIDLLVDIVSTTPALARHLSRNSGVFDAVIGGSFFADWPGMEALQAELGHMLAQESDYEAKLDTARRWAKEWHFGIGVHLLRGLVDAAVAGRRYADLAEAVIRGLWPEVVAQFASRHGAPPGRGAAVVGMGSLGAARLNPASDLDLIVIYDPAGTDMSDGRRPLQVRPYYARLTQALVTALSAPMAEGRLYEVDMRLRPSGSKGPVATSWESFTSYQQNEAWIWEHLALTRARVVAGHQELGEDIEAFRARLLKRKAEVPKVLAEVAAMRARIAASKPLEGPLDAKIGAGRLQDIELLAQACALLAGQPTRDLEGQLAAGVGNGLLSDADRRVLAVAARLFWQLQVAARLLSERSLDPDHLGEGAAAFLGRMTEEADVSTLVAKLDALAMQVTEIITRCLPEELLT